MLKDYIQCSRHSVFTECLFFVLKKLLGGIPLERIEKTNPSVSHQLGQMPIRCLYGCLFDYRNVYAGFRGYRYVDESGKIVAISTIAAVVTAAVALLLMNFSKNSRTVDESRAWLKRIIISWAILNGLGFIMAYITPLFAGGTYTTP